MESGRSHGDGENHCEAHGSPRRSAQYVSASSFRKGVLLMLDDRQSKTWSRPRICRSQG